MLVLTHSSSQNPAAGVTATTITTCTVMAAAGAATSTMGSPVKRLRPLLPKETALAKQQVMWNPSSVQQKEITQNPSTSTITLVTSTYSSPLVTSSVSMSTLASSVSTPITTASADVAADTAKYTSNVYRATKSPVAVPTVLGHEIQLGANHAEMWSSLEQEQGQLIAEVKKQLELEKWQAVDETKK
ncbi:hypothetical protein MJT46_019150 [Ovis ammon polii x Ovis aries]|nr:hypothetical protein MJT46_019150 [Ovis ammon polii x Ovis aries]